MPSKKPLTALQIAEKLEGEHNLAIRAMDMASGHPPARQSMSSSWPNTTGTPSSSKS